MSIFCYNLEDPQKISTFQDLYLLIATTCRQIPATLHASMNYGTQCMAFRLCCDEDILSLKQICKKSPVSILYTPKQYDFPQEFKGFEQNPIKSLDTFDFTIISSEGVKDGDSVPVGSHIEKVWKVEINGSTDNLDLKCVEGDYFGVNGQIEVNNQFLSLKVNLFTGPRAGWSSSYWRIFSFDIPFGPGLWIEMMVE
jgi:hypothetical protein